MPKDYKSFSGIAKTRFKPIAKDLGYEQISGTFYLKQRSEWFDVFFLQKSSGNDFFYVTYGISIPYLWSVSKDLDREKVKGPIINMRLHDDHDQGFDCDTKLAVEESAAKILSLYKEQANPWLSKFSSLKDIADYFFHDDKMSIDMIGEHSWGMSLTIANYGLMLYHAGDIDNSRIWLSEAERLYSLPMYSTRDGRWVHEKEKYARLVKPEDYEIEQHDLIKKVLNHIGSA